MALAYGPTEKWPIGSDCCTSKITFEVHEKTGRVAPTGTF